MTFFAYSLYICIYTAYILHISAYIALKHCIFLQTTVHTCIYCGTSHATRLCHKLHILTYLCIYLHIYVLRNDFSVKWRSGTNTRDWVFSFWYMTLTAEYYQQCCYLIYILLPIQSGSQTNWESASVFPLRSTHFWQTTLQFLVRARPRCTQAGSSGQIKAD